MPSCFFLLPFSPHTASSSGPSFFLLAMPVETVRPTLAARRKSLRSFLQIPLLTRRQASRANSENKTLGSVPFDILLEIAEQLLPIDLLHLSLSSSGLRSLLLPILYTTVVLKSSRQCRSALLMFAARPEIARHVKKLAVRPNYYLAWPKPDELLDELWVSEMVEKIAPSLLSLRTFDWDGLEMPKDNMWLTLRKSCPLLKTVFSNIGSKPIPHSSYLFDFEGLSSFSLIVRHGLGGSDFFPPMEELPDRFWDMILHRCPDLEELTICSFSSGSRLLDFQRITAGRWPKLHTLTLGSFGYQSDFSLTQPSGPVFSEFLAVHSSLKNIRLSWNFKRWMSPETIHMDFPPTALPLLDTFNGIYQQLAELPNASSIETLDLTCEPIYELRLPAVCPILQSLTSLTSLDIWTYIENPDADHSHFFSSILTACPLLNDFHFMCTTSFTAKPLKQLAGQLHLLPHLKTFSLTKGHKYRDESMLQSALRILRYNPGLQQINIRWARETCPNHLKQEGTYDVTADDQGLPVRLLVCERGLRLVGQAFTRRYKHELKQSSLHYDSKRLSQLIR